MDLHSVRETRPTEVRRQGLATLWWEQAVGGRTWLRSRSHRAKVGTSESQCTETGDSGGGAEGQERKGQ